MMHGYRVVTFLGTSLGIALGAGLAASPVAVADAIDDAWPYGASSSPYYVATELPGYQGPHTYYPDSTAEDVTYLHHPDPNDLPEPDEWYTVHQTISTTGILSNETHQVVTALLDDSAFPHVGTVADSVDFFRIIPAAIGLAPLITNSYLDDPTLGFADQFDLLNVVTNTYLSDAAGVKDVLSVFGLPLTLFEFPTADPGAAASEPGDGFAQLLAELTGTAPGPDTLPDLF
jgi:hypothetical protein